MQFILGVLSPRVMQSESKVDHVTSLNAGVKDVLKFHAVLLRHRDNCILYTRDS
jgi:hypothetical protein